MTMKVYPAASQFGRRAGGVARLLCAIVLAAATASPWTAHAAGGGTVSTTTTTVLGRFDAAALLPPGPLTAVASLMKYPAGYTLTHHHGGLRLVYALSGTTEVTDDAGTVTHHAGDFWIEPAGHSHTAHALTDTTNFVLDLLPPGAQTTVAEGTASGPTGTQRTVLGTVDTTGLFPKGPLNGVVSLVTFPTGFMQKHYHGGSRFVYQLSGTIQIADEGGEEIHQPGYFFVEPHGHVHTANVITQATNLVIDFVTPGTNSTYPLVAALPAAPSSMPGGTDSFTVSYVSALPGSGMIRFGAGPGCVRLVGTARQDSGSGTALHSIKVGGISPSAKLENAVVLPGHMYFFETVTMTAQFGPQIDNNDGKCYSVTLPGS